jgi:hypothetical protein
LHSLEKLGLCHFGVMALHNKLLSSSTARDLPGLGHPGSLLSSGSLSSKLSLQGSLLGSSQTRPALLSSNLTSSTPLLSNLSSSSASTTNTRLLHPLLGNTDQARLYTSAARPLSLPLTSKLVNPMLLLGEDGETETTTSSGASSDDELLGPETLFKNLRFVLDAGLAEKRALGELIQARGGVVSHVLTRAVRAHFFFLSLVAECHSVTPERSSQCTQEKVSFGVCFLCGIEDVLARRLESMLLLLLLTATVPCEHKTLTRVAGQLLRVRP